jgi:hypothetical protein
MSLQSNSNGDSEADMGTEADTIQKTESEKWLVRCFCTKQYNGASLETSRLRMYCQSWRDRRFVGWWYSSLPLLLSG